MQVSLPGGFESPPGLLMFLQGGPLPVMNGVITCNGDHLVGRGSPHLPFTLLPLCILGVFQTMGGLNSLNHRGRCLSHLRYGYTSLVMPTLGYPGYPP